MKKNKHHPYPGVESLSQRPLWWALGINLVFLIVEILGGIMTHSLALLADAGHMLTDVAALGLALLVSYLARQLATPQCTFGLLRAEVLGAFVNGGTLVLILCSPRVAVMLATGMSVLGGPQNTGGPLRNYPYHASGRTFPEYLRNGMSTGRAKIFPTEINRDAQADALMPQS